MGMVKITISIDAKILNKFDKLVEKKIFSNRNEAIQIAVEEKITKIDKNRLAKKSAKLNKNEERSLSEKGIAGDFSEWSEY